MVEMMNPARRRRSSITSGRRSSMGSVTMSSDGSIKPLSKLDFSKLKKLYGRDSHIQVLTKALEEVRENIIAPPQVVLVYGQAGVGKSALIRSVLRDNHHKDVDEEKTAFYYVEGKFDQYSKAPFAALSTVFNGIFRKVKLRDEHDELLMKNLQKHFQSADLRKSFSKVRSHQNLVTTSGHHYQQHPHDAQESAVVMDNVDEYHGGEYELEHGNDGTGDGQYCFERLKSSIRDFLRAVCNPDTPVIMFLDDLQWADAASLELFQFIATDADCHGLLLIGSYRDNEMTPVLRETVRSFRNQSESKRKNTTELSVHDLAMDDLQEMIADLIATDGNHAAIADYARVNELTQVVYDKTGGNVFYAIHFLQLLHEEELIYVDPVQNRWEWAMDEIWDADLNLDHNSVTDVVTTKLQKLPRRTLDILKLAACLGSNFDIETISMVEYTTPDDVRRLLETAEQESIVEKKQQSEEYRFVHDRLQQAAYLLNEEGEERDMQHLRIGRVLRELVQNSGTRNGGWTLFTAVDQLNLGADCIDDDYERFVLIDMNMEASDKAIEMSAFLPAREYLRSGLALLRYGDRWKQYKVTLELCTKLAAVECSMGCFDECQETIDEVMMNTKRLEDKIPVHFTTVEMLSVQGRMNEAMNLCVALLNLLGEPINVSPSKVQILNELMKAKRLVRGKTDEMILGLDEMNNANKIEAMKVLGKLSHMAWWTQEKDLFVIVCFRMIIMTMTHGIHDISSLGFALYGVVNGALGNDNEAFRFAQLALESVKQRKNKTYAARTLVVAYSFSVHLKSPLHESLNPFMEAYKVGMETGDVEYSSQACNGYSSIYLACGLPLAMVEPDMRKFAEQMKSYNQGSSLALFRILYQTVLNFMGRSQDPLVFEGEAMKEEDLLQIHGSKQVSTLLGYWFCRMMLAYHFGDYQLARRMADAIINNGRSKTLRTIATGYSRRMLATLTMLAFVDVEKPKKRKESLQQARKHKKVIESMAKQQNVNCHHSLLLVKAEFAALKRSKRSVDDVRALYDKAIASASRLGFLQDAALANQRAGFYMIRHNNMDWGEHYVRRAHGLYAEWGAVAKTRQLEASFTFLQGDCDSRRNSGTFHLARRRFDGGKTKMHKSIKLIGEHVSSPNPNVD